MIRQPTTRTRQQATNLEVYRAYIEAAATAKGECDRVLDLLVDEIRKEGLNQLAETFQVVLNGGRRADALLQWALLETIRKKKVPQNKIDELQGIQVTLATCFIQKPG